MKLLLLAVLSVFASEVVCKPIDILKIAPTYKPHRKRDFAHLDEIGIPFAHLVHHIKRSFPEHKLIAERKVEGNKTLSRLDIPDDIWHDAVESFPHEKRQANLYRRNFIPAPPGTEGPADSKFAKRTAISNYRDVRLCIHERTMTNAHYDDGAAYYCRNFDDTLKTYLEDYGPEPPTNNLYGPWVFSEDGKTKGDLYYNFMHDSEFPWDKVFLQCRDRLESLNDCGGKGMTGGGKAGWQSKLGEGEVDWACAANPDFSKDPLVI
ncbi:hypothetical protein ABW20_dc0104292 [Dactylellina cionopaga]|nr:hypothetical protein ABW20_dc0104292 [Dactylellina cionopaga]